MRPQYIVARCISLLGLAFVSQTAHAICQDLPQTTTALDGMMSLLNPCTQPPSACSLLNAPPNCDLSQYVKAIESDFNMTSDDWGNRGENICVPTIQNLVDVQETEMYKFFNAVYFFVHGVQEPIVRNPNSIFGPFGESFHGSEYPDGDYWLLTWAYSSWHPLDRFQTVDALANGTFADYDSRGETLVGIPDLIRGSCRIYDSPDKFGPRLASADPVFRALEMVHESWHGWEQSHGMVINSSCGHTSCPSDGHKQTASCNSGGECDIWFPHPQGACPPCGTDTHGRQNCSLANYCASHGDEGFMATEMHRPYQAESEFGCDLANTPQDWVPAIARELAAANADFYETNDSTSNNGSPAVQPACYSMDFGVHYAACPPGGGQQCDEANFCPSGSVCNPQSGCCQTAPLSCTVAGQTTCDGKCVCNLATHCCSPVTL